MSNNTTRRCTKCKEYKPATLEYFYKARGGLCSYCKPCKYAAIRCWQKAHPEKKSIQNKRWQAAHPEVMRTIEQRRRARKRALPATLTAQEWDDLKAKFDYRCAYCGKAWFEIEGVLEQEHVIPVTRGGAYTADNIVPACKSCNSKKGNRTPEQAGMTVITMR